MESNDIIEMLCSEDFEMRSLAVDFLKDNYDTDFRFTDHQNGRFYPFLSIDGEMDMNSVLEQIRENYYPRIKRFITECVIKLIEEYNEI